MPKRCAVGQVPASRPSWVPLSVKLYFFGGATATQADPQPSPHVLGLAPVLYFEYGFNLEIDLSLSFQQFFSDIV